MNRTALATGSALVFALPLVCDSAFNSGTHNYISRIRLTAVQVDTLDVQ